MSGKYPPRLVVALILLLFLFVPLSINAQDSPKSLLIDVVEPDGRAPQQLAAHEARSRSVRIDYELLGGSGSGVVAEYGDALPADSLKLNLFEDADFIVQFDKIEPLTGRPGFVWHGYVESATASQVIFSVLDGQLTGYVQVDQQIFEIQPDGDSSHRVVEIDQSGYPELSEDGVEVAPPTNATAAAQIAAPEDDGSVLDLLILYTEDARIGAGGTAAMESFLAAVVAITNESYINSNVAPRVRLVHTAETVYTESGNGSTDLGRLNTNSDGFMDEAFTLRTTYGADMVALITETLTGCGIGNLYNGSSNAGFTVTLRTCALGNLTFAHELGHNMGARHDWYVDATTGTAAPSNTSDNHGRSYFSGSWRTVMAYGNHCSDLGGSCTRVSQFSNPGVNYLGVTTGFAAGTNTSCTTGNTGNPDCDADNARVFDATAATMAMYATETVLQTISAEASAASVRESQRITYTLTVRNDSTSTANGIVITSTVPANAILDASTLSGDASNSGTSAGSQIVWTTATNLASGANITRTFAVTTNGPGLVSLAADSGSTNGLTTKSNNVETRVAGTVGCGFYDGFESAALSSAWATTSTNEGRIQVGTTDPYQGSYSVLLDDSESGVNFSEAAIIVTVDLAGQSEVWLDFWWREWDDEVHSGSEGVFISDDYGASWSVIHSLSGNLNAYESESLDIDSAAATAGLTLNDHFQIKFQFYDNFPIGAGGDGYSIDNVNVRCSVSSAAVWDGGGSTNNWSEAANWTGDVVPNGVPVIFNATSSKDAVIDGGFTNNISDFTVSSGYTGTIDQNSSLLVTGNYYQLGGTLVLDGTDAMDVNGDMTHDGGVIQQTRTVSNADVAFTNVTDAAGTTVKYRGIDLDTTATTNNLGAVTVSIAAIDSALDAYCTLDGSNSPPYVFRCIEINPTNNLPARLTLWSWGSELAGIAESDLAIYRFVAGSWTNLGSPTTGNDGGGYSYVEGNTPGFSSFLMGNGANAPTAIQFSGNGISESSSLPVAALIVTVLLLVLSGWYLQLRHKK